MRVIRHLFIFLIAINGILFCGCMTNLVWEGGHEKYIEVAETQPAELGNIYLNDRIDKKFDREIDVFNRLDAYPGGICVSYRLSGDALNEGEKDAFPEIKSGYYVTGNAWEYVEDRRIIRRYEKNRALKTIIHGPIDLDIMSVNVKLSRLSMLHRSKLRYFLQSYQYLGLSEDSWESRAWEREQELRRKYKYFLFIDIKMMVPDKNIVFLDVADRDLQEGVQLSSEDSERIDDYCLFMQPAVNKILKQKYDKYYRIQSMSAAGWISAEHRIVGTNNLKEKGPHIGVLALINNQIYVKLLFGGPKGAVSPTPHEDKRKILDTSMILQPTYRQDGYVKYYDVSRIEELLPQNPDFKVSLEFMIEEEKRVKFPLPVRILLTPFSLAADAIIFPLTLVLAPMINDSFPR